MHPAALLDLTTELLRAVLRLESPADAVVSAYFRQHRELGPRERHVLAETAYAVLRRKLLFEREPKPAAVHRRDVRQTPQQRTHLVRRQRLYPRAHGRQLRAVEDRDVFRHVHRSAAIDRCL